MMNYNTMTTEAITARVRELTKVLDNPFIDDDWNKAYGEYATLTAILDERFREESQAEFDAFYREHIEGKTWKEIDPEDWNFYSDWHKDMYGFRPHRI